jgi:TonB family protein
MRFFLAASCVEVARYGRPRYTQFLLVLALLAGAIVSLIPAARGATPEIESRWMLINTSCTTGKYPLESRLNGHQGTTFLQYRISPDGSVKSIRIEKSSGHRELDLTAQRTLAMCRFKALTHVTPDSESEWTPMRFDWTLQ